MIKNNISVEKRLREHAKIQKEYCVNEEELQYAIKKSKEAFWESESVGECSWMEFLYQQAAYIQKRWWVTQGILLIVLWAVLYLSESSVYQQRCMGILTPCFAVLILPELWKNRTCNAMEVEGAAYFSLRKIYTARMILFGMADTCLLTLFFLFSAFTVRMEIMEFLIQFILPLNVSCCICFQTLRSKRNISFFSAVMFCMGWIWIWVFLVLNDGIYERISIPVWIGMIVGSFIYLCYCIMRIGEKTDYITI